MHEDIAFNTYHCPVWVYQWYSDGTNETIPSEGTPIICAICGRVKDANRR